MSILNQNCPYLKTYRKARYEWFEVVQRISLENDEIITFQKDVFGGIYQPWKHNSRVRRENSQCRRKTSIKIPKKDIAGGRRNIWPKMIKIFSREQKKTLKMENRTKNRREHRRWDKRKTNYKDEKVKYLGQKLKICL